MGNREAFYLVNEGFNLVRDDLALAPVHIEYIDFENPENNIFKVVNQYTVQDVRERRPDLVLFINGLPIAILSSRQLFRKQQLSMMLGSKLPFAITEISLL